jgi:hypothetical protein
MKILSICIPTRNRQIYAMSAVREMVRSERQDFEIILADNSDDAAPLAEFFAELNDPRVKLLEPEAEVLSMRANWERMVPHTTGEWVSYIGDDDYLDPELCEVISVTTRRVPTVDAISWGRLYFIWPEARQHREVTKVPTGNHLIGVDKQEMMRKLFFWEEATDRPQCPFGVYHGTVRRSLMDEIRDSLGGVYFGHPIVDYDNICRTVLLAKGLVHFERPMSVFGACKASNTFGMRDEKIGAERMKTFKAEMDGVIEARDFPFPLELGITAQVAHVIESFKQKQGIEITAWEDNFVRACAYACEAQPNRELFNQKKNGYAEAIREWRGEAALKAFKPVYKTRQDLPPYIGLNDKKLSFDMSIGNAQSAAEFYAVLDAMMFPIALLEGRLAA